MALFPFLFCRWHAFVFEYIVVNFFPVLLLILKTKKKRHETNNNLKNQIKWVEKNYVLVSD